MRRLLLLLLAVLVAGCDLVAPLPTLVPTLPSPQRTPVPTWTLPFEPSTATAAVESSTPNPASGGIATLVPGTPTPIPTEAQTPTPSPTARPGIDPTLGPTTPDPNATLVTPIPEPMPQLRLDAEIVNILLLGRDTARDTRGYRTDVMIVVSLNKKADSVTMLTLPRDLFVYVPGWTMTRLNTAATHGDAIGYPGGGVALLEQTILYNFGVPLHGWARIDFDGFKQVVDILGGVDIPVSCEMADWRLKEPTLDPQNADNWEMFTVAAGVQHMDGDYALWYARSRKHSSDFDRSRRQHQVLRAMYAKALQLKMLLKLPELFQQYVKIVDTDLGLGDLLQFVPMAARLDGARIKSRFVGRNETYDWVAPDGARVLLPDREAVSKLLAEAFLPPAENVLAREAPAVEIWNCATNPDFTALAVDNLAWEGLRPVAGQADATSYATTTLYDFTSSAKGSARPALQRIFHLTDANVVASPDPNAAYPYRVVLGADYNACVRPVVVAHATPTPGAPLTSDVVHAAPIVGPPPRVDGDLTEWTYLVYPADEPSFGRENWRGPTDLSARWNIAWDDAYLYLALKVKDDVFAQPATGEQLFMGDSLELWLDSNPGGRTRTPGPADFQLGISMGDLAGAQPRSEAYLWMPKEQAREVGDVMLSARLVEGGYQAELAVPWTVFGVTPFSGEGFAFTLALNDNDTPGAARQETQTTSLKDARLADPTTWGLLTLDPPP